MAQFGDAGPRTAETVEGVPTPRQVVDPEPVPVLAVEPGDRIGRYIALRPLGRGGMGIVVLADDPELDRRVAIKLLRPDNAANEDLERAKRRLQREAQAIARLSHPNVVAVHDVGRFSDGVFIAMEYVDGDSLRGWLRASARSLDEILAVFIAAGRGLAAAHAGGLVHRDVKPDNILVGSDGQVKVLDFGLARALSDRSTGSVGDDVARPPSFEELHSDELLAAPMTIVGQVMGTPAYMSPEQALGRAMTAKSDQYSLCVSLYEAVVGSRPFEGRPQELVEARAAGVRFPEHGKKLPRALQRVLVRGLAHAPSQRFSGMDELLRELTRLRHRRRRTALWIALASVVSGGASFGYALSIAPTGDPCAAVGELDSWGEARRDEVSAAFTATGSRVAEEVWPRVAERLDDWAQRWSGARMEACAATLVDGRQSGAVMDLRMACLDRHRQAFDAVVGTLGSADLDVVTRAADAVAALPANERCADIEALGRLPPMPTQPDVRDRVASDRRLLAEAAAARQAGRYDRARDLLAEAFADLEGIDYPPLTAEHALESARLAGALDEHAAAEAGLRRALAEAERVGYPALRVEALLELGFELGYEQKRYGAAEEALAIAQAVTRGLGDPEDLIVRRRFVEGEILLARDHLREAFDVFDSLRDDTTGAVPRELVLERMAAADASNTSDSLRRFRDVLVAAEARYGPNHPRVADALVGLGRAQIHRNELEGADQTLARALAIRTEIFGATSGQVADVRANQGVVAIKREDYDTATRELEWAERVLAEDPGGTEFDRATMIGNLGIVYSRQGRQQEARQMQHRALEVLERADRDHPRRVVPTINIAMTYQREGRLEDAIEWFSQAAEILLRQPGGADRSGDMEASIGELYAELKDGGSARMHFRRALDLYARSRSASFDRKVAEVKVAMARLSIAEGNRGAAREQLESLLAEAELVGAPVADLSSEIREILAGVGE